MTATPNYLKNLKVSYKMSISIRPLKNGNYNFRANVTLLAFPTDWSGIQRDILKPYLDNWRTYFSRYNINLTKKKNQAIYLESVFPNELILQLREIGFKFQTQRLLKNRDIIEYRKAGNNIYDIEEILFAIFKTNVEATEIVETSDLLG